MKEGNNTTTPLGSGEHVNIRFSTQRPASMPGFELQYNPVDTQDVQVVSSSEISLQAARVEALQAEIDDLREKLQGAIDQQAEGRQPSTDTDHERLFGTSAAIRPEEISVNGLGSKLGEVHERFEIEPDPMLSPSHRRYEKAIIYLLLQPNLEVRRKNAGGFMRQALEIGSQDWNNLMSYLRKVDILYTEIDPMSQTKLQALGVNLEVLLQFATDQGKKYITPRVIGIIRKRADVKGDEPEPAVPQPQPVDEPVSPPEPSTNGHGSDYKISRRVQKMMAREPGPRPGPVSETPLPIFHTHHHRSPGAGTRGRTNR